MRTLLTLAVTLLATGVLGLHSPVAAQQQQARAEVESASTAELITEGMRDGRIAAQSHGTSGYAAGGFLAGVTLGLIGTGIAYAVASGSDASIGGTDLIVANERGPTYMQGYQEGFRERLRDRRKSSALAGGLVGTAVIVAVVLSAGS
jgi:hypothetical protein